MEADFARFYGIDYRDRWRGGLTLRRVYVLVKHLPPESATAEIARDGDLHWSIEAHLLDDLRMVLSGDGKKPSKPHPSRPKPGRRKVITPERARKLAAARRRAQERRRKREAGEL